MATLSNCGEFLKLYLPSISRKSVYGRGNDLGYGKNDRDIMGNPQPSPKVWLMLTMEKVQRLNGTYRVFLLKYSLAHSES